MKILFKSTLLPNSEHREIELENDNFDVLIEDCCNLLEAYPKGEFRIEILEANDRTRWLIEKYSNVRGMDLIDLIVIAAKAEKDGWPDSWYVMATVFFEDNNAEDTINYIETEDYEYDYASGEDDAFVDFAQQHCGENIDSDYHDYINWEQLGRDRADGSVEFVNGCTYVYRTF